jgi:hypothetical protein
MRIVINDQNATHSIPPHIPVRSADAHIDLATVFVAANQPATLISDACVAIRLPCTVYKPCHATNLRRRPTGLSLGV